MQPLQRDSQLFHLPVRVPEDEECHAQQQADDHISPERPEAKPQASQTYQPQSDWHVTTVA